jgi:hypothetical protein
MPSGGSVEIIEYHDSSTSLSMPNIRTVKNKSPNIKTPQALIHIKHRISLLQYKYWLLMIRELRLQIDKGIPPNERGFRTIQMKDIVEHLGYTPNKSELWEDLQTLKNQTIAYNLLEKDGGTIKMGSGFILEWGVTNHRVDFKLPSFIEELVKGLDAPKAIFQALNWDIFNLFAGKYQAFLYKLCRDYRGVGRTPYMTIAKFRDYMGIEEHEYKEFRDLNRVVISGPMKDINAFDMSDITIGVNFDKQGRKVIGLQFDVYPRNQLSLPMPEFQENPAFQLARVKIDEETQRKYLDLRTGDEIEKCIIRANEYADQQIKANKDVNYGALYRKSIQEGWHTTIEHREEMTEKTAARKRATQKVLQEKEETEAQKNLEIQERIAEVFNAFAALPEKKKDVIREEFRATLTATPLRKSFDKQGEEAPIIRSQFAEFFMNNYKPKLSKSKK